MSPDLLFAVTPRAALLARTSEPQCRDSPLRAASATDGIVAEEAALRWEAGQRREEASAAPPPPSVPPRPCPGGLSNTARGPVLAAATTMSIGADTAPRQPADGAPTLATEAGNYSNDRPAANIYRVSADVFCFFV